MNKKLRIISLLLLLTMLVGVLVGCKNDGNSEIEGSVDSVSTQDPSNDDNAPTPYMIDFGGYEFRVLTRGGSSGWINNDITGDFMGSVVDRAVAERNAAVTTKYNFTIYENPTPEFNNVAATMAGAGEDAYDMWSFMMRNMPQHGISGYLYDLREIEWLDVDASWYDQEVRKTSTFGDYLFFLTGDLLYIDENSTAALIFDHEKWDYLRCAEEFDGRDLYTIVKDGDWTFEKLKILAARGMDDTNGDGEFGENDEWGFRFENSTLLALNVGFGNTAMSKDRNDLFVVNDSVKQINDYQTIQDFLTGPNASSSGKKWAFVQYIWLNMLNDGTDFSGYDYGLLPYPKLNDDQENYHCLVTTYGACGMSIPITVADVNKVGSIMDIISYESQKRVLPAYEEWLFAGKPSQRPEDNEMLKFIMDGQVVDPAHLWLETGLYDALKQLIHIETDSNGTVTRADVASTLEAAKSKVSVTNSEMLDKIKNLY